MNLQRGNALFLILIAVALFAALSYAITQSGRGGGSISKEQAKLYAAQITQAVAAMQVGIDRLSIGGTASADITVGDPGVGTDNGSTDFCSTGDTCLFAPEGGGVAVPQLPVGAFTNGGSPTWTGWTAFAGPHSYQGFHFDGFEAGGVHVIPGAGTGAADGNVFVYPLKKEVCEEIRRGLGYTEEMELWESETRGPQECAKFDNDNEEYIFYTALAPR